LKLLFSLLFGEKVYCYGQIRNTENLDTFGKNMAAISFKRFYLAFCKIWESGLHAIAIVEGPTHFLLIFTQRINRLFYYSPFQRIFIILLTNWQKAPAAKNFENSATPITLRFRLFLLIAGGKLLKRVARGRQLQCSFYSSHCVCQNQTPLSVKRHTEFIFVSRGAPAFSAYQKVYIKLERRTYARVLNFFCGAL
jgi:hypothetical protein